MNYNKYGFLIEAIRHNRMLRRKLAQWSHPLFNAIYLPRYASAPTAEFQREMFRLTEDKKIELCVIAGFRESGKTSICAVSFPLWAILSGQAHFIVLACQTRTQVRGLLGNIRKLLEENPLLKNDFGPFLEESDEWGAFALVLKKYDAKIMAVSTETAIRGLLYKHYRPDLIVCDDIENLESTRHQESRDKIYNWFVSEIVPLGSKHTRIFVLGNFLHEFSLVGRLMAQIEAGERDGVARRYPLLDEQGICLWPGMYPDAAAIETKRRKVNDETTWSREYLLTIIASNDKLVPLEWIHYYDAKELPKKDGDRYLFTWAAADLAISQREGSDFTAIVSARVYCYDEDVKIFVLPYPLNKRLDFPSAIAAMKEILHRHGEEDETKLFVETVGFQEAYYQQMFQDGYQQVESVKVTLDKATRLALITEFIRNGTILFPSEGADELITQLVGFGKEHHDDLVDALTMLVSKIMAYHHKGSGIQSWINWMKENGGPIITATPTRRRGDAPLLSDWLTPSGRLSDSDMDSDSFRTIDQDDEGRDEVPSSPAPHFLLPDNDAFHRPSSSDMFGNREVFSRGSGSREFDVFNDTSRRRFGR